MYYVKEHQGEFPSLVMCMLGWSMVGVIVSPLVWGMNSPHTK